MKFSLNFLKEFLEIKVSPDKLSELLTMAGLEVIARERVGSDTSFEVEVTSNRPDLLSIVGIAYEASALLGKKSKVSLVKVKTKPALNMPVTIESKKDCSLYIGRVIENVKITPSPAWLVERLKACGINSVSNVVDITNYCMLKWGQPLHAFDLDKLSEKLIIRRARPKEKLICIDNKERELNSEALVIADGKKPIALAGVIGGKTCEVSAQTKRIFLEAAIFSPIRIRRTRRLLGINTESSYRFERAVNPAYIEQACFEAASLIERLSGGKVCGYKKIGTTPPLKRPRIKFEVSKMNNFLGTDIKENKALQILKHLGFKVDKTRRDIFIKSPLFRQDISVEQDLFEEIARIWGYQNIKEELPAVKKDMEVRPSFYRFKEAIREKAIRLGFKEIITLSIVSEKHISSHLLEDVEAIRVVNPLRADEDLLRPFVFLGMLERLRHNVYRKQRNLEFFEIADSFIKSGGSFKESPKLCLGVHSDAKEDFYVFKGKVEAFLKTLGIEGFSIQEREQDLFSNFCLIENLGWIGILGSDKAYALDLNQVFLAEFDLEALACQAKESTFVNINYLPWVERDISMAVRGDVKFNRIEDMIKAEVGALLKGLEVCDVYKGEKISKDFTGFTLRVFYQHKARTLEAQEVDSLHFSLRDALASIEGVILR